MGVQALVEHDSPLGRTRSSTFTGDRHEFPKGLQMIEDAAPAVVDAAGAAGAPKVRAMKASLKLLGVKLKMNKEDQARTLIDFQARHSMAHHVWLCVCGVSCGGCGAGWGGSSQYPMTALYRVILLHYLKNPACSPFPINPRYP